MYFMAHSPQRRVPPYPPFEGTEDHCRGLYRQMLKTLREKEVDREFYKSLLEDTVHCDHFSPLGDHRRHLDGHYDGSSWVSKFDKLQQETHRKAAFEALSTTSWRRLRWRDFREKIRIFF